MVKRRDIRRVADHTIWAASVSEQLGFLTRWLQG